MGRNKSRGEKSDGNLSLDAVGSGVQSIQKHKLFPFFPFKFSRANVPG